MQPGVSFGTVNLTWGQCWLQPYVTAFVCSQCEQPTSAEASHKNHKHVKQYITWHGKPQCTAVYRIFNACITNIHLLRWCSSTDESTSLYMLSSKLNVSLTLIPFVSIRFESHCGWEPETDPRSDLDFDPALFDLYASLGGWGWRCKIFFIYFF